MQVLDFYILFAAREYTVFLADPVTILLTPSVQQQLHLTKALSYTDRLSLRLQTLQVTSPHTSNAALSSLK